MADPRRLHGVEAHSRMAQRPEPAAAGLLAQEVFPGSAESTAEGPASWHCAHLCSWEQPLDIPGHSESPNIGLIGGRVGGKGQPQPISPNLVGTEQNQRRSLQSWECVDTLTG